MNRIDRIGNRSYDRGRQKPETKGGRTYVPYRSTEPESRTISLLAGVDFVAQDKDPEGLTVWKYPDNKEIRRIIDEYLQAQAIRAKQREGQQKYFKVW